MIICPQCSHPIFLDEEEREQLVKLGAVEAHDNTCRSIVLNQMDKDWHTECYQAFQSEYNAVLSSQDFYPEGCSECGFTQGHEANCSERNTTEEK